MIKTLLNTLQSLGQFTTSDWYGFKKSITCRKVSSLFDVLFDNYIEVENCLKQDATLQSLSFE